ncbi:MAG: hypothetical protein KBT36_12835 [Kurthia sp.]|nr:hypothetical protein [Candidatus Kurthia equi]
MKLRNLALLIMLLVGLVILFDSGKDSSTFFLYATWLCILVTPFILVGYSAMSKKYKGQQIVLALIFSVIGSFFVLYMHYFLQGTPLMLGIPQGDETVSYDVEQLLFTIVVRMNLVLTIVYGMYFSVPAFRKKE